MERAIRCRYQHKGDPKTIVYSQRYEMYNYSQTCVHGCGDVSIIFIIQLRFTLIQYQVALTLSRKCFSTRLC